MSSATEAKPPSKKPKLMGPAQTEFDKFTQQCIYFADLYWPDWNNYENPSSYIIPPIFNYKQPDVSDEAIRIADIETIRLAERAAYSTMDRVITDRTSDIAEHIVYTALQQLIEEKVRAPFIVIQNLSIHNNQTLIRQLFPMVDEEPLREAFEKCREYDFLLIGHHVGVVAIEVKSSEYRAGRDFVESSKLLPQDYCKGIQQLESSTALSKILSACAEIDQSINTILIRRILFTPNLSRERYDTWKNSIGDEARKKVESYIKDVIQLFAEDVNNRPEYSDKLPLYSTLRDVLLETSSVRLPTEIVEKYALLLSGFRSMIRIGKADLNLETAPFSHNEAISLEHIRINEQNPFHGQMNSKESKHSLLKRVDLSIPKLFFLSPDQQIALEGPARQFIIGTAGTGKTIILQAKALQLLSEDEEVVVFAPQSYKEQYEKLFESYGFRHYQCLPWPHKDFEEIHTHFGKYMKKAFGQKPSMYFSAADLMGHVFEYAKEQATCKILNCLFNKNVMIDDASDVQPRFSFGFNSRTNLFVAWTLMACFGEACPTKTVWTALDSTISNLTHGYSGDTAAGIFHTAMKGLLSNGVELQEVAERFGVSTLKQVMRCSESIYLTAYTGDTGDTVNTRDKEVRWINGTEPVLAHKIQGSKSVMMTLSKGCVSLPNATNAMIQLCDEIQETLRYLSREGVDMTNVAIIIGMVPDYEVIHKFSATIANATIPIYKYDEVSSMEWPVVIYASCFWHHYLSKEKSSNQYVFMVGYPRYRAVTRATTKLIEITVTYIRDSDKQTTEWVQSTNVPCERKDESEALVEGTSKGESGQ